MDTGEEERQRRGSVASVGASKGRRDEDEVEEDGGYIKIRQELEEYIFNENNKVSKTAAKNILASFTKLEAENIHLRVRVAKLEGQLSERRMESREVALKQKSFADVVGAPRPMIGKKEVVPKPIEKTVLVYPTDGSKEDSEDVKKVIKEMTQPKDEGWPVSYTHLDIGEEERLRWEVRRGDEMRRKSRKMEDI